MKYTFGVSAMQPEPQPQPQPAPQPPAAAQPSLTQPAVQPEAAQPQQQPQPQPQPSQQAQPNALEIYTDGACSGNPGQGGWATVLLYGPHRRELSGYCKYTTNNRMELQAVIEGLKALKRPSRLTLYSDSTYVIHAMQRGWLMNWQRNNWRKADKKPVENADLWEELLVESLRHEITWVHVRGHAQTVENNRCDELARQQIAQHRAFGG